MVEAADASIKRRDRVMLPIGASTFTAAATPFSAYYIAGAHPGVVHAG